MNPRYVWIDYAKAIGIALVVYGHVARGLVSAKMPVDVELFSFLDNVIYSFHMPLFFFLSGVLFLESFRRRGGVGLVLSKCDTVIYPYLVWSIIQGCLEVLLSKYTNGNADVGSVLALLWQPRAQFWFLYSLFFVFLLAVIFYSFSSGVRSEIVVLFVGCGLYFSRSLLDFGWIFKSISIYFVFFCFGVLFNRVVQWSYGRRNLLLSVFFVLFLISQVYLNFYLARSYSAFDADVLFCAIVSLGFVVFLSMFLAGLNLEWVAYIGAGSMYIYLMHIIVGSGVRVILGRFLGISSVSGHLILGTLFGIALPLVAVKYMKGYKTRLLFEPPVRIASVLK